MTDPWPRKAYCSQCGRLVLVNETGWTTCPCGVRHRDAGWKPDEP